MAESDEFWLDDDDPQENKENISLSSSDTLDACKNILDCGDESDKEEEIQSDHYTDSEEEWEPDNNENLGSDDSVENDTVVENNEQIDEYQRENIAPENEQTRKNYWYGKKDKMKWSKTPPKKCKTLSNNLIKFLAGVKGLAR